jgi:hypothetical protein
MPWVVGDAGVLLDHLRHPWQGPQVVAKPGRPGTSEQHLLDPGELLGRDPRRWSRRTPAAQRLLAAVVPAAIPAADVLPADAQLAHDLSLGDLAGEQRCRLQAELFLEVAVARRAPTPDATALLGRHGRSSHTDTSM